MDDINRVFAFPDVSIEMESHLVTTSLLSRLTA